MSSHKSTTDRIIMKFTRSVDWMTVTILVLLCLCRISSVTTVDTKRQLLVVLLDGFRPQYLNSLPKNGGFKTLIREGVMAEYMKPGYPSESYPGYYSIATGLWGENNGMSSNIMYDKNTDSIFQTLPDENSEKSFWWEQAEPVWVTTTKNNISTGSFRWPGASVPNHGIRPKIATPISIEICLPLADIDKVLDMFQKNELQYAQIYSGFPDIWGHLLGPGPVQYILNPLFLDPTIKKMTKKIREKGLENSLNVIVLSDHGMARSDIFAVKMLRLKKVLNSDDCTQILADGSHLAVVAKPGKQEKVYNDLKKLGPGAEVYWKKDLPERYHIKKSDRIPDIFVIIKKGYFLDGLHESKTQTPKYPKTYIWEGYHGYDTEGFPELNAIFIGWGPDFKKGEMFPPIDIVDPYNLIARLAGVTPLPNNGTWSHVKDMLTL